MLPLLPLGLAFFDSELSRRRAAGEVFDLRHRLPFWSMADPDSETYRRQLEQVPAPTRVAMILAIRLAGGEPMIRLGNNGDAAGEPLPGRGVTCEPSLLRDFRDVAAARFSDTRLAVRISAEPAEGAVAWPKPLPLIHIGLPQAWVLDQTGDVQQKRVADLRSRFETILVMFCKIQSWL